MKRRKFFEDLDRSLSGEPEPEPEPVATVAPLEPDDMATQLNRAANAAFSARLMQATQWRQELEAAQIDAIRNTTATGAMILAQQQRQEYGFGSAFGQLFGDALGQGFRDGCEYFDVIRGK